MRKRVVITSACIVTFVVLAWGMGGRTGFDYGLTCTKCLEDYQVVEHNFLGVTYRRSKTLQSNSSCYREIKGHECQHIYHKGGFGKSQISWFGRGVRCGSTAEGIIFRDRNQAIQRTFVLYRKLQNIELSARTLNLIDRLLPADFDWRASPKLSEDRERLVYFSWSFQTTNSEEAWKRLLDIAERGSIKELSEQIPP